MTILHGEIFTRPRNFCFQVSVKSDDFALKSDGSAFKAARFYEKLGPAFPCEISPWSLGPAGLDDLAVFGVQTLPHLWAVRDGWNGNLSVARNSWELRGNHIPPRGI